MAAVFEENSVNQNRTSGNAQLAQTLFSANSRASAELFGGVSSGRFSKEHQLLQIFCWESFFLGGGSDGSSISIFQRHL